MMFAAVLQMTALATTPGSNPDPVTPATVSAVAVKPPPKDSPQDVVCQDEQETGGLFFHKVCATREVWDARRRQDLDDLNHQRDQAGKAPGAVMRY